MSDKTKPENPPAFPRPAGPYIESEGACANESEKGMTLLDYFAGQAVSAMIVVIDRLGAESGKVIAMEAAAENAYLIAGHMLAERAKHL